MATLENATAVASGIVIVAVATLVFMIPQAGLPEEDLRRAVPAPQLDPALLAPPPSELPRTLPTSQIPLVQIFEHVEGSVVSVRAESPSSLERSFGSGSGFVFDTLGHIITNEHVVNGATRITVTFLDGRSYSAEVVGVDAYTDIAVIRADVSVGLLQPLRLGDSSRLRVGEPVAAIGNPFGLSGSMTSGIVSQLGRLLPTHGSDFSIPGIIQTDAPINPGNSGGPLLNSDGEVIGMNTAIQSTTGQFAGVGFAVPSKTILKVVPQIIVEGAYHHPWIGVSGIDVYPELADALGLADSRGFLVSEVIGGGPADRAGIRGATHTIDINGGPVSVGGDIILVVDGTDVRKIDDILIHLQREKSVGDSMELVILRDDAQHTVLVTLDERPRAN